MSSLLRSDITALAKEAISLCIERNRTFGTAESCTGGLIAAAVTDIPGASSVFYGGIVSYVNEVKHGILGVKNETLDRFTAVSEETAAEMANGARKVLGVDFAVAVTGFAGPGGGTPEKPVGTVCVAVASQSGVTVTENHFEGDREAVRLQTVLKALSLLTETVRKEA